MSKLKVDDIQSRQSTDDAISLASDSSVSLKHSASAKLTTTSTGVTVTGTCTANTFSGSGASLTSIPAANLTGTLPAIDGSNLTGVGGGGSLEFVSKTTVTSSAVAQVDFTGLDYGFVYKLVGKKLLWNSLASNSFFVHTFINGSSTVAGNIHDHHNIYTNSSGNDVIATEGDGAAGWRVYLGGPGVDYQQSNIIIEFSTDYYAWGHILMHGQRSGYGNIRKYSEVYGHFNSANHNTSTRISGIRISGQSISSSYYIDVGSEFILYKYKES
tara:strand:+ start:1697 stop:2509 length:813 start_codon:yes stop_codon:yes gene_type:complete